MKHNEQVIFVKQKIKPISMSQDIIAHILVSNTDSNAKRMIKIGT